ncbi:sigma-70 family RNA polymerase sigma factor [Mycobacterium sp. MMS18-G62]
MTALPDWDVASDAELACAAAAGDRDAFAEIYDRYADRLHDFCIGMLRNRDTAADCVQDTFCIAATRLPQLKDGEKLRPWLYSITRNEALRYIRAAGRERISDEMPETVSNEPGPDVLAARSELADLVAAAAGGLSDRDRSVLEMTYRHGLDGPELAQALGVSHSSAKKMAQRLRETVEKSLGALLVSRRAIDHNGCADLRTILDGWDGKFTVLMRKRIARHIESCADCDQERRRLLNPVALLGAVPVFIPAPKWLREHTLNNIELPGNSAPSAQAGGKDATESGSTNPAADKLRRWRRIAMTAGVVAAIMAAGTGLTIAWMVERSPKITPANLTNTVAPPTSARNQMSPNVVGPSPTNAPTPIETPTTTAPTARTTEPSPPPSTGATTTTAGTTSQQLPVPTTNPPTSAPTKTTYTPPASENPTTTQPPSSVLKPTNPVFRPTATVIKPAPVTTTPPILQ